MQLTVHAIDKFPEVLAGDDIADLILEQSGEWTIADQDIVVIAQKIVSKSENRFIKLSDVNPSKKSIAYSHYVDKDPRVIELILSESNKVIRTRPGLMIVQHKLGFICANGGIDQSNIQNDGKKDSERVLLLPENPDRSARQIQERIQQRTGRRVGVIIIDSHGRPWRNGVVGVAIGVAGVPGVVDRRGAEDRFGKKLRVTEIGAADELAAAASILMGQANEGRPVVWIRGFPYPLRNSSIQEMIRKESEDLFR